MTYSRVDGSYSYYYSIRQADPPIPQPTSAKSGQIGEKLPLNSGPVGMAGAVSPSHSEERGRRDCLAVTPGIRVTADVEREPFYRS